MNLIQGELDGVKREWNFHRLRKCREGHSPGGVPELLYYAAELQGELFIGIAI